MLCPVGFEDVALSMPVEGLDDGNSHHEDRVLSRLC
jgi:hypothetical protein